MAKDRKSGKDDGDEWEPPICQHCKGNAVVVVTFDGEKTMKDGGTGADFHPCPICKGTGRA